MRVPLPGRDGFPPRVLLRGPRPSLPAGEAPRAPSTRGAAVPCPAGFAWGPSAWPAVPPAPSFAARPAA